MDKILAVSSAIRAISEAVASLDIHIKRVGADGEEDNTIAERLLAPNLGQLMT